MSNVFDARTNLLTSPASLYTWSLANVPQTLIVRKSISTVAKWTAITSSQIVWLNIIFLTRTCTNSQVLSIPLETRFEAVSDVIFASETFLIWQLLINILIVLFISRKSIIAHAASLNLSRWAHWSTIWRAKHVNNSGSISWLDR